MKLKRSMLVVALVLALATATGGTALAQGTQDDQAILRVVHAVPGALPVDVFVDNNQVFSNVEYKEVTEYAALSAGRHSVRVVAAGAGAQGQALIDTAVSLPADTYNTVAVVGQTNSVRPLVLVNNSTLPVTTQSRVRIVHASPDAPAVDVAARGGPVLFGDVSFGQATDYRILTAQTQDLEVRQAGTNTVVKEVPNVTLNGATVHSIFIVGLAKGQPPLDTVVATDAPPPQAFRAVRATATPQATETAATAATPATTS